MKKTTTEGATAAFTTLTPQTFIAGFEKSVAAFGDAGAEGKRNVEALAASISVTTKGAEALGADVMAYSKAAFEGGVEHAKALAAVRTPQDFIALQTSYAKGAMDAYLAQLNRGFELVGSTLKAGAAPLTERAAEVTAQFRPAV